MPIWMVRTPAAAAAGPIEAARYSFDEVAAAAGITADELREVERFGLVIGRAVGGDTFYDEDAVVAARTAGGVPALRRRAPPPAAVPQLPPTGRRGSSSRSSCRG